jgi:hypothetical protein
MTDSPQPKTPQPPADGQSPGAKPLKAKPLPVAQRLPERSGSAAAKPAVPRAVPIGETRIERKPTSALPAGEPTGEIPLAAADNVAVEESESAASPKSPAAIEASSGQTLSPSAGGAAGGNGDPESGSGEEEAKAALPRTHSFLLFNALPSWMTSMIFHVIVLLFLALLKTPTIEEKAKTQLVLGNTESATAELEDFSEDILDQTLDVELPDPTEPMLQAETELVVPESVLTSSLDETSAAATVLITETGSVMAADPSMRIDFGAASGTSLSGRGAASRARMVREGGGTKGSEEAVGLALEWIARHQNQDGSWSLNHQLGPCQGRCGNPGLKDNCNFGATGLALLPFLGAGHTHLEGEYKDVVNAGLAYLLRNIRIQGEQGSLVDDGNYYSHGLCAITLCEAYAMTKDRNLMVPAQMLINHTVAAQDPIGGGWRYGFQQPGDTSAVGWQVMALKSAHMAYLNVPAVTIQKASHFLDSVQTEYGAKYGYTNRQDRRSTTAVGLLCRMYLGWDRNHPPMQEGVAYLAKEGPQKKTDIYTNYYATQIMRHYGGDEWEKWNEVMRDYLIETQAKNGHEKGSWFFSERHNDTGGRLYTTSLSTMILEVYYRHMPLYKQEAAEDDFPF